jgi:hypothetical protein
MTEGRRSLHFASFDEIMPDVERLLTGHRTVGRWSLGQICRHLATTMRRVIDLPADTPIDPSQWVAPERKQAVLESGQLPEGIPAPPLAEPPSDLDPREEAEALRQALDYFRSSPGPVVPHRIFGPLSRDEWERLQLIHSAHHLSFAIPSE